MAVFAIAPRDVLRYSTRYTCDTDTELTQRATSIILFGTSTGHMHATFLLTASCVKEWLKRQKY